ncbi:MAG: DUF1292 domain-containing protein [Clostridia bacterium]|nr:DUF1292 domain-containing protein [Clostridia bacterium]
MIEDNEELNVGGCSPAGCAHCSGCSDDFDFDSEPTLTLVDDDGKEVEFEILDVIVHEDGKQYLIVTEAGKEEEDAEAVILEVKEDENGEEYYDEVTDEEVAEKVFDEYIAQFDDEDNDEED